MANKWKKAKNQRKPKWLTTRDHYAMSLLYGRAKYLRRKGFRVSVDHIIPLRGDTVSGLHVPKNLQIISEQRNRRKSAGWEG